LRWRPRGSPRSVRGTRAWPPSRRASRRVPMAGVGGSTSQGQAGDAGQQGAADGAQQAGFDAAAIDQQFQAIGQGQEELRHQLAQLAERIPQSQQEEVGQEPEPIDLTQFLDDGYEDSEPSSQDRAQQLQQAFEQMVEQ